MTGPDAEQEPVPELSFSETYTAVDPRLLETARAWEATDDEHGPTEAELTIAEAAAATGASERTLRRKLSAGSLPGARMAGGRWLIPEGALRAAGYTLAEPTPEADRAEPTAPAPEAAPDGWLLERAELLARAEAAELLAADQRAAADDERHQRELAEQRAAAAERLADERLERADRAERNLASALAGIAALSATAPAELETVAVESTPRRRWWQRR